MQQIPTHDALLVCSPRTMHAEGLFTLAHIAAELQCILPDFRQCCELWTGLRSSCEYRYHAGADEDAWEVVGGALAVRRPVLLATERELAVLADGGVALIATLPLAGVPLHHPLSAVSC